MGWGVQGGCGACVTPMIVGLAPALTLATLLADDLHQTVEDEGTLLLVRRGRPVGEVIGLGLRSGDNSRFSVGHLERLVRNWTFTTPAWTHTNVRIVTFPHTHASQSTTLPTPTPSLLHSVEPFIAGETEIHSR